MAERQTVVLETYTVTWDDGSKHVRESILYDALPDCKHKVKTQWSGVKCVKCNGWFCY